MEQENSKFKKVLDYLKENYNISEYKLGQILSEKVIGMSIDRSTINKYKNGKKRHLKFILPGSGMTISIISLILIKLISTFFPTPIARQAESGTWYTGFIGFIDYYNLYGIVNIALLLFMLSFTFFSFFIVKKKNKSKKNILLTLIGYAMIMIFCIKSLYEINTKPFVSLNFLELVISIIYIACAILLFSREIKD